MVLNMLSTAAMARLGHVYENLMIDVKRQNQKVSDRIVASWLKLAAGACRHPNTPCVKRDTTCESH